MKACLISPDKPFVLVSELEPKLLMSISAVTSALYTANCSWESIVFSIRPHNGWTFMVKSLWIMEWDVQWVTSTWRERENMFQRGCCGHIQHNAIYSSRTWTLFLDQHSLLFLEKHFCPPKPTLEIECLLQKYSWKQWFFSGSLWFLKTIYAWFFSWLYGPSDSSSFHVYQCIHMFFFFFLPILSTVEYKPKEKYETMAVNWINNFE